jgi:pyruvate-formate lyase-activating enzyme
MRIQTFSVVAGSEACNARCPFCVSRMTPSYDGDLHEPVVRWRNFDIACRFARDHQVSTVLLTGKGEPTLFPGQLTRYLRHLEPHGFPFVELQTNGIAIAEQAAVRDRLAEWYESGLTLVALSVVHWKAERNRSVYRPDGGAYPDLAALVGRLHAAGLAVRLSCTLLSGYIDSAERLEELTDFCRREGVEQLTVRPVERPESSRDPAAASWIDANRPKPEVLDELRAHLDESATRLLELPHGAIVYDRAGQNVCLSNCLTIDPSDERIRQLIFFPDGHLRYDWQYPGAILI